MGLKGKEGNQRFPLPVRRHDIRSLLGALPGRLFWFFSVVSSLACPFHSLTHSFVSENSSICVVLRHLLCSARGQFPFIMTP